MENRRHRIVILSLLPAMLVAWAASAGARQWKEEDFWPRAVKTYAFTPAGKDGAAEQTVIGENLVYKPEKGDTFFDLARYFDLGYNELVDANPAVDEWTPGHFEEPVHIPQQFVLPNAPHNGIVINVPEMRLYYFRPAGKDGTRTVITFPVGLGREEWKTPVGSFKIREKTVNPTWVIPASIRKERIADKGYSEKAIPGGDPANPLGKYRMRLTLDLYGIHGTNIPWGVGMLVSHGCVRLYPEDIDKLYPMVPVGTPGQFVYQPVKIGRSNGRVFVEVHKDLYGMRPGLYRETVKALEQRGLMELVDEEKLREAVLAQSGVPADVSRGPSVRTQPVRVAPTSRQSARIEPVRPPRRPAAPGSNVLLDGVRTDRLAPAGTRRAGAAPAKPAARVDVREVRDASGSRVLLPAELSVPVDDDADDTHLTED